MLRIYKHFLASPGVLDLARLYWFKRQGSYDPQKTIPQESSR